LTKSTASGKKGGKSADGGLDDFLFFVRHAGGNILKEWRGQIALASIRNNGESVGAY
jgi:hypothetical protein